MLPVPTNSTAHTNNSLEKINSTSSLIELVTADAKRESMTEKRDLLERLAQLERKMLEDILAEHRSLQNAMKVYEQYKELIRIEKIAYVNEYGGNEKGKPWNL